MARDTATQGQQASVSDADAQFSLRALRSRERIIRATAELLGEFGPYDFTMQQVAERAEASKQTIYRFWPSREDLIYATVQEYLVYEQPEPDTGSLRGDVLELLHSQVWLLTESPIAGALPQLHAAAARDPQLYEVLRRGAQLANLEVCRHVVARAVARGELEAGTDPDLFGEMARAPIQRRKLITFEPVPEEYLAQLAERVIRAFAP